ncbi:hypothetical protein BC829DRAFT_137365 [Chytridium lagenaria]|nr:hypothetical protein BC829DRAFT_137365 [Chytridium lagenaria]
MWIEVKAALSTSPEHLRKFGVSATKEDAEALMVISEGGVGESYGYECLRWNVGRVFGEGEWVVFYKDDEGDWIGMSSQEEFLEGVRCKGTGALRVMVERGKKVEAVTEVVPVVETEQNTLEPVPMPTKHAQVTFAPLLIDTEDTLLSDSALEPGFQHSPVLDDAPPLPPRSMEQESLPTPVYSEETPPVYDESRSVPVDDEKAPVVTSTINELQYYRLIIQTAISEGVRNLFETQDPSHPNNLDYAIKRDHVRSHRSH